MFMNTSKKLILLFVGLFILICGRVKNFRTAASELKEISGNGYLKVIRGHGEITQSDYPQYVHPSSSLTRQTISRGGYDPNNQKLTLVVGVRQIEILLSKPLIENSSIKFHVSKITKDCTQKLTLIPYLYPGLWIHKGFRTEGVLMRRGNQISGEFISQGSFDTDDQRVRNVKEHFEGEVKKGKVKGKFTLVILGDKSSAIPTPYRCYRTLTP